MLPSESLNRFPPEAFIPLGVCAVLLFLQWLDWRKAKAAGMTWRQWRRDMIRRDLMNSGSPDTRGDYYPGFWWTQRMLVVELYDTAVARLRRLEPWVSIVLWSMLLAFAGWLLFAMSDDAADKQKTPGGGTGGVVHMDNVTK